jgi:DNA-binding GntR family transcriptional regulator
MLGAVSFGAGRWGPMRCRRLGAPYEAGCPPPARSCRAARLLAGKHPLLHGVPVPLTHRLGRARTGKTVHFQLTPLVDHGQMDDRPRDTLVNPEDTFAGGAHAHRQGPGVAYNAYNGYRGRVQTDTARRRLRALILDGTYPAGTRVTELEVAAALGMSRTPVREAIRALAADGLVRPAGWGVAVVALDPSDLEHAYQVRAALEGLTAELAADRQRTGRIAPADLASVRAAATDAAQATAAGRLRQAVEHNRRFHQRIAELAGNPIALSTLDRLWDQILVSTLHSLAAPARPAQVAAQHDQLLAAIADGRGADAGRIARQHALDTRASTHQEG